MKKTIITLIVVGILVGAGIWWRNTFYKNENNQQVQINTNTNVQDYQANRSSTNTNVNTNTDTNMKTNIVTKKEVEIANFSTKIYNKDEDRQNNINITCKTLSVKEVQPGETFSFCDTVGKATHAKGYEEADIYVNGKKEQGLGGGNCQVSTTLYNAVVQVPELEVIERHEHSGHVPYIEDGKDAAVAYGVYDFKFKNNTNSVVKIVMENTVDNIIAKLIKM